MALDEEVLSLLHELRGVDFRLYRPTMIERRARARIAAACADGGTYLEKLRTDGTEADRLVSRLTIKVSRFFRDPEAFARIGELALALPCREGPLRVWSAGCGFGEEPYSLALLLEGLRPHPQIVATDVDVRALETARAGRFAERAIADVPAPLAAAFTRDRGVALLADSVRARVRFLAHDLTSARASPEQQQFDVVACRNVLIYLLRGAQQRVFRLLAESVAEGGILWLGEAEWIAPEMEPAFEIVDRRARIFRRKSPGGRR